jgi:hypothetical protein
MTLTEEDIEYFRGVLKQKVRNTAAIDKICDLALRGLATMPRPIEEAPKDGTSIILIDGRGATQGFWIPEIEESSDQPPYAAGWLSTLGDDMDPTHFIPLSALEVKP